MSTPAPEERFLSPVAAEGGDVERAVERAESTTFMVSEDPYTPHSGPSSPSTSSRYPPGPLALLATVMQTVTGVLDLSVADLQTPAYEAGLVCTIAATDNNSLC